MRLFVMTLGHSRKSVRLLVFRSSTQTWAELHEKAFRRLGGATRVVVLDNLREGVLAPDLYDPSLNPLYRDVLKHYGAVALPCRVRDPQPPSRSVRLRGDSYDAASGLHRHDQFVLDTRVFSRAASRQKPPQTCIFFLEADIFLLWRLEWKRS